MKGTRLDQESGRVVHTEPSSCDFLSVLMSEMPSSPRSTSLFPAAGDLRTQRKVEIIVQKADLEVRAWLKERKTAPQALLFSLRRLLERELRTELPSKPPQTAFSKENETTSIVSTSQNSLNRSKSPFQSISTLTPPTDYTVDMDFYQLSASFTESVKRFLAANKLQTATFSLKLARMRQELNKDVEKMEGKLLNIQKNQSKQGDKQKEVRDEAKRAIEYMAKMVIKEENMRWKQINSAQNALFSKVARLLERLKAALRPSDQLKSRNTSISSLVEIHGEFRSIKQLLESCMPGSPQPNTSFPSFDQWSESTDLWEKLRRREEEVGSLQREISRLKGQFDEEKWAEMVVQTIRLDSQLEVAEQERDQANALALELRTGLEMRITEAALMINEDYRGYLLRIQAQHYREVKALHWRIWQLEDTIKAWERKAAT